MAEARGFLESAYRQARSPSSSWMYYARAYFRFFLPGDLVPQLRTAMLTPALAEDLLSLADQLDQEGRGIEAAQVRRLIAAESAP